MTEQPDEHRPDEPSEDSELQRAVRRAAQGGAETLASGIRAGTGLLSGLAGALEGFARGLTEDEQRRTSDEGNSGEGETGEER